MTVRIGRARVPGTCGELVQGTLDGVQCLVSCPIACYSAAEVMLDDGGQGVCVLPLSRPKTVAAVALAIETWQIAARATVRLCSHLPWGRGYASSTADIGAALYALALAAGIEASPL